MKQFQEDLVSLKNQMALALPQEIQAVFEASLLEVNNLHLEATSVQVGDLFPTFNLVDMQGESHVLSALLAQQEVVVAFIRGGWCPYCQLQMKVMEDVAAELKTRNITLLVVSPQDQGASAQAFPEATFPVLWDKEALLAKQLGIAFTLEEEVCAVYSQLGVTLTSENNTSAVLPLPAVYHINQQGHIAYRYVATDYTQRISWDAFLNAL